MDAVVDPLLAGIDAALAQFAARQMHASEIAGVMRQRHQRGLVADIAQIDARARKVGCGSERRGAVGKQAGGVDALSGVVVQVELHGHALGDTGISEAAAACSRAITAPIF